MAWNQIGTKPNIWTNNDDWSSMGSFEDHSKELESNSAKHTFSNMKILQWHLYIYCHNVAWLTARCPHSAQHSGLCCKIASPQNFEKKIHSLWHSDTIYGSMVLRHHCSRWWLLSDNTKPLPELMLIYCQLHPYGQAPVKFQTNYKHFHQGKCPWKYCPQNDAHLVQASMY